MRTTPFPDIIRMTPAPGVYPGFTPSPPEGEEIVAGKVDTLFPLPQPPSVTDSYDRVTPVVPAPGFDLTDLDVAMAPTGEEVTFSIDNKTTEQHNKRTQPEKEKGFFL